MDAPTSVDEKGVTGGSPEDPRPDRGHTHSVGPDGSRRRSGRTPSLRRDRTRGVSRLRAGSLYEGGAPGSDVRPSRPRVQSLQTAGRRLRAGVVVRRLLGSLLGPDAAEQDAAWRRAESLLCDSLTPAQYAGYRSRGYVEVESGLHPGRTYRVDGWRPVAVHERGQFVGAVCIRPREHIPGPDILLARKLMIEGAEAEFLRSGNWLQPAWRPAGAAPTIFLVFALLSPWLLHLRALGLWGVSAGMLALGAPGLVAWLRRSRRRALSDSRSVQVCRPGD